METNFYYYSISSASIFASCSGRKEQPWASRFIFVQQPHDSKECQKYISSASSPRQICSRRAGYLTSRIKVESWWSLSRSSGIFFLCPYMDSVEDFAASVGDIALHWWVALVWSCWSQWSERGRTLGSSPNSPLSYAPAAPYLRRIRHPRASLFLFDPSTGARWGTNMNTFFRPWSRREAVLARSVASMFILFATFSSLFGLRSQDVLFVSFSVTLEPVDKLECYYTSNCLGRDPGFIVLHTLSTVSTRYAFFLSNCHLLQSHSGIATDRGPTSTLSPGTLLSNA